MKTRVTQYPLIALGTLLLTQCSVIDAVLPPKVIYALSPQSIPSPLDKELPEACPPIIFSRDHFLLNKRQRAALKTYASERKDAKQHLLIVGFAQRGFPASYARSLAQRRAESVRQVLIEEGIDAAVLHSIGFGHDQPALGSEDEVRVFVAK